MVSVADSGTAGEYAEDVIVAGGRCIGGNARQAVTARDAIRCQIGAAAHTQPGAVARAACPAGGCVAPDRRAQEREICEYTGVSKEARTTAAKNPTAQRVSATPASTPWPPAD